MRMRWRQLWQSVLDVLFPSASRCIFCQRLLDEGQVCFDCLTHISHPAGPLCPRCGHTLLDETADGFCWHCRGRHWAFSQARSIGPYQGDLRLAVHRLKFQNQRALARVLAQLMYQAIEAAWWDEVDSLVPVPLHPQRLQQRGYNQAQLLAYELSLCSRRPMRLLLQRPLDTLPQTRLDKKQRQLNLQGAFRLAPGQTEHVRDKCLLLVDDVLTTGSTLDACARVLRRAGGSDVRVVTVAITDLKPK